MKRNTPAPNAFSLVEVVLALGVASFCLVTLVALMPVGMQSHHNANEETRMAGIASRVIQDLQSTPSTLTTSPEFGFDIPAAGAGAGTLPHTVYLDINGKIAAEVDQNPTPSSFYRVSVNFIPPASGQRAVTAVRVVITWPAMADPNPSSWATNYSGIFQTMTSLNRN